MTTQNTYAPAHRGFASANDTLTDYAGRHVAATYYVEYAWTSDPANCPTDVYHGSRTVHNGDTYAVGAGTATVSDWLDAVWATLDERNGCYRYAVGVTVVHGGVVVDYVTGDEINAAFM